MKNTMKFTGRNFSVEMKQEIVDEYGLTLWDTVTSTHEGRWCKVMHPVPSVIELIDQLEDWDEYLDEGVSDMEKIIIKAKQEYKEEEARRAATRDKYARLYTGFSLN